MHDLRAFSFSTTRFVSVTLPMSEIRFCTPDDLPRVAELFQLIFRQGKKLSLESLVSYLHEIYFRNPWYDEEISSRVFVSSDGMIQGFIGVLALPLSVGGRTARGAIPCSLMVNPDANEPFAGARLLRSIMRGPQDLAISDSANSVSRSLVQQLGGSALPLDSLDWVRMLRPTSFVLGRLAGRLNIPRAGLLRLASQVDSLAVRGLLSRPAVAGGRDSLRVEEVTSEMFSHAAPGLVETYPVHPAWTVADWAWLLSHAEQKQQYGTLVRCLAFNGDHEVVGGFLYFNRPHDVAHVLQVLYRPGRAGAVVDSLMAWVDERGCAGVRGRTQAHLMGELFRYDCTFRHRCSTVYYTRDPALLTALRSGEVFLGGFVGESWTRWASDDFDAGDERIIVGPTAANGRAASRTASK
jgi:hypothetical protein